MWLSARNFVKVVEEMLNHYKRLFKNTVVKIVFDKFNSSFLFFFVIDNLVLKFGGLMRNGFLN